MGVFPCSSMVEQEAVNFEVASSSLAGGAIFCLKTKQKKRDGHWVTVPLIISTIPKMIVLATTPMRISRSFFLDSQAAVATRTIMTIIMQYAKKICPYIQTLLPDIKEHGRYSVRGFYLTL